MRTSGPIPDPVQLAAYAQVQPDFPERLLALAEREQAHRHGLESTVVNRSAQRDVEAGERATRGQHYALIVALVGMATSVGLAFAGAPVAAAIVGALDIATLAGAFLLQARSRAPEAEPKQIGADDDDDTKNAKGRDRSPSP